MIRTFTIITLGIILLSFASKQLLPRGIRNNNPGNIRRNNIEWEGAQAVQTDPDFVQFVSPEYGFRAMARILRSYQQRGLTTIREIISTYAPSTENKTESYISFVSDQLDISPDSNIDLDSSMFDLIKAITTFENGLLYSNFYLSETIANGIALA